MRPPDLCLPQPVNVQFRLRPAPQLMLYVIVYMLGGDLGDWRGRGRRRWRGGLCLLLPSLEQRWKAHASQARCQCGRRLPRSGLKILCAGCVVPRLRSRDPQGSSRQMSLNVLWCPASALSSSTRVVADPLTHRAATNRMQQVCQQNGVTRLPGHRGLLSVWPVQRHRVRVAAGDYDYPPPAQPAPGNVVRAAPAAWGVHAPPAASYFGTHSDCSA